MRKYFILWLNVAIFLPAIAFGQANGKLQIHFMDVGQGDGALLISPQGETVLFDDGVRNDCDRALAYLQQLGITEIDYHIASHYHDDHIGCAVKVLQDFPLKKAAYDRGGSYNKKSNTFTDYTNFVGPLRKTAIEGSALILDQDSAHPVHIEFVAMNGNGIVTDNENDLSLVSVVRFGKFDAVFGGDLSGFAGNGYKDIETSVAPKVGQVEVYKVNHHGSRYSTNPQWIGTLHPKIGIISCGENNKFDHPTTDCLARLHSVGIITYWTESGNGATPMPNDKVGGNIFIEVAPSAETFTVTYADNKLDSYSVWNATGSNSGETNFVWSVKAKYYHYANCKYVQSISLQNRKNGSIPPSDKQLHLGCPK